MSAAADPFHELADLLQARLAAWPALATVTAVVDRQMDVRAEMEAATAKASGCGITILFVGWTVPDENTSGPRMMARFNVSAWGLPIIAEADENLVLAGRAIAEAAKALHHFVPSGTHNFGEAKVGDGGMPPDRDFLVYDFPVTVPLQL